MNRPENQITITNASTSATTLRLSRFLDQDRITGLIAVLVTVLAITAVSVALLSSESSEPIILTVLAVLSFVGVFGIFAFAIGMLRFGEKPAGSRNLTRIFADQHLDGLLITDLAGNIHYANSAYLRLVGGGADDEIPTMEQVFAGNTAIADQIFRLSRAAQRGQAWEEDVRLVNFRSGPEDSKKTRWFRISTFPLTERPGETKADEQIIVWRITETTGERARHEDAYQKLQEAIEYLDSAPTGFFSMSDKGQITYINATLTQWLGLDLADTVSGKLKLENIMSGQGATLIEGISKAGNIGETQELDIDLLKSDGTSLPVRLLLRISIDGGGLRQSQTMILKRANRGETGEEGRVAEVRFARFFHSAPIAIATVGIDGRIGNTNTAFSVMFNRSDAALVKSGASLFDFVSKADRETLTRALMSASAGQVDIAPVDIVLGAAGDRNGRLYFSPIDLGTKGNEAAILYAIDTTEQKALEVQIAQSQKMQAVGQLAGGIAHDFNNVLTAIIGFSDLLLGSHRPTDPAFQDIMNIKQNANRAAGLVRQLLAFSRQQTLRPEVLVLSEVIEELRVLLSRLIGEKIKLNVIHGRDLWFVKADFNQFEQVVINLVVNARDAMTGGGELTIRTLNIGERECIKHNSAIEPGEYVLIEVSDTGCGIPEEIIEKIFDPFFSTKEVGKGTGLGLSTVYGIVKQTGGYIYADSEMGEGTTFRIYLPKFVDDKVAEVPATNRDKRDKPKDLTGSGCVLLVEDEEAVRSFAARALSSRGYEVLEASTGVDALALMDRHEGAVDLVVSDVVMPEMDGPTLLRELRKRNADLKIIFISGYAEDAFKRNLADGEQFAFLPKPFSLKQLAGAVKETMLS